MQVKEELATKIDSARHCRIAELAALMGTLGFVEQEEQTAEASCNAMLCLKLASENELVIRKAKLLISDLFGVRADCLKVVTEEKNNKILSLCIDEPALVTDMLMTLKWCDEQLNGLKLYLLTDSLFRRIAAGVLFLEDCFWQQAQ
jgi:hypothetical protein